MKKIKELLKEKTAITICVAAGTLLLFMPQIFVRNQSNEQPEEITASDELEEYANLVESRLQKAVAQMTGSDSVKVIVTLDSTFENIYVSDASINEPVTADKTDIRSEKQLVLTGASGQPQTPVVVKRIPPKIKGVVIVCPGGNDKNIRSSVAAMVATALNISETKIYVTGGY